MSDANDRSPVIRQPDEGEQYFAGGDRYRFLAVAGETDGGYGIWEAIVPPGGGPPPHLHRNEDEGFYVIEGEVTIHVGEESVAAGPGAFVNMPRGTPHWFRNETDQPAKLLILVAPGGMEGMFKETGQPVTSMDDPIPPFGDAEKQRLLAVGPKYGIEVIPPSQD